MARISFYHFDLTHLVGLGILVQRNFPFFSADWYKEGNGMLQVEHVEIHLAVHTYFGKWVLQIPRYVLRFPVVCLFQYQLEAIFPYCAVAICFLIQIACKLEMFQSMPQGSMPCNSLWAGPGPCHLPAQRGGRIDPGRWWHFTIH